MMIFHRGERQAIQVQTDTARREYLFGMLNSLQDALDPYLRTPRVESARELTHLAGSLADYVAASDEAESAAALCEEFAWLTNTVDGLTERQCQQIHEIRRIAIEAEDTTDAIVLRGLLERARTLVDAACRIQERKREHFRRAWSTDLGGSD
jgi:hypothetical protein